MSNGWMSRVEVGAFKWCSLPFHTFCEENEQVVRDGHGSSLRGVVLRPAHSRCGGGTCFLQAHGGQRQLWGSAMVQLRQSLGEEALVRLWPERG